MRQEFSHISAPGSQVYRVRVNRAVFHVTFPCIPSHMQPTCCSVSSTPAPLHMHTLNFSHAAVCWHTLSCSGRQSKTTVFTLSAWDTNACWHLNSDWDVFCKCLFWSQSLNFLWVSAVVLAIVLVNWWVLLCVLFFFLPKVEGDAEGLQTDVLLTKTREQLPDVSSEAC